MRRFSKSIQRELDALPVPWEVLRKKSHYFLRVDGRPLICVGGNASRLKKTTEKNCVVRIRRLRKELEA